MKAMGISVTRPAKTILRPFWRLYLRLRSRPAVRRWLTANYSSGQVALGEQNGYGIPARWITVDRQDADFNLDFKACNPLPFRDASLSVIYSCHMIEHVDLDTLRHLLAEAYRVLAPGGYIRFEAPDAKKFVAAYWSGDRDFFRYFTSQHAENLVQKRGWDPVYQEDHIALIGELSCYSVPGQGHTPVLASKEEVDRRLATMSLDEFGTWCVSLQTPEQRASGGHISTLYFEKLAALMGKAGFRDVLMMGNGETRIPVSLWRLERSERAHFSFYTEARK